MLVIRVEWVGVLHRKTRRERTATMKQMRDGLDVQRRAHELLHTTATATMMNASLSLSIYR